MTDDLSSSRRGQRSTAPGPAALPERAIRPTPEQIADMLRRGRCPADSAFDRFLPEDCRAAANQHWTPLCAVQRAARWIDDLGIRTVVDIGSGAGKFCVAAALAGEGRYIGLEQRPRLVAAARALAELFGVEHRVRFVEGTLGETEVPAADAYYLYNPFEENLFGDEARIDADVELSCGRFQRDVALAEDLFRRAAVGTCLLTYNGFGGRVPADYQKVRLDRELPSVLRMWRKVISPSAR